MNEHFWTVIVTLLSMLPSTLGAITAYLAYRSGKENSEAIRVTNGTVSEVADKVEAVHLATNSMKDQLVAATDAAAHARGMEDATDAAKTLSSALAVAHAEGRAEGLGIGPPAEMTNPGQVTVRGSPVIVTESEKPDETHLG